MSKLFVLLAILGLIYVISNRDYCTVSTDDSTTEVSKDIDCTLSDLEEIQKMRYIQKPAE